MQDLTKGNPTKLILMFTFPIILGYLMQQLYNFVDTLIVGQTLGVDALAAVGSTGAIMFLSLGFVGGFSSGMSIITATRFGAKDSAGVRKSFGQSILASIIITIGLTIISLVGVRPLLILMQTPPEILDMAHTFIVIILGGIATQMGYNVISNAMRAVGNSNAPLYHLVVGMLLNIGLEFLFILVFHWGVAGAAIATVIAYGVSTLTSIWHVYKFIPTLRLSRADLVWDSAEIRAHLAAGLPLGFQQSIIAIGSVTLQAAVNSLGTDAVAANAAASKVDQLVVLVLMSFGVTMATYVAQNHGAGQYDRILVGMRQTLMMSIGVAILLGIGEVFAGHWLVQLFVDQSDQAASSVMKLAQIFFYANGPLYSILAVLFVLRYAIQGLGDTRTPTLAGIGEMVARTVAAFALVSVFGFWGASFANPLAWTASIAFLIPAWLQYEREIKAKS